MPEDEEEGQMNEEGIDEEVEGVLEESLPAWGGAAPSGSIHIETGRGQTAEVPIGAPFVETVERVADEAHYGGYFRVFLNGDELTEDPWMDDAHTQLNPSYPETIDAGMRIAVTSYDKVGAA